MPTTLHVHEKMKKYLDNFIFLLTFLKKWLGRLDSNQGMAVPKTAALPLGYAPMRQLGMRGCARFAALAERS